MSELDIRTSHRTSTWPWALGVGGLLFLVGGLMHPAGGSTRPEPLATAEFIGAPAWIPSHTLLLVGTVGLLIGLFALARSRAPLSTGARRAAWVAAIGGVLLVVEGAFHLAAFADEDAVLAGAATPFLSTHQVMSLFVYPLFTFSVAALAVLSGRTLTHPAVSVIGALGAVCFGVAPALVGLAGIEALSLLFPIGGSLMALWFTVVGITCLTRRAPARV